METGRLQPGCRPAEADAHDAWRHAAAHIVQFCRKSQQHLRCTALLAHSSTAFIQWEGTGSRLADEDALRPEHSGLDSADSDQPAARGGTGLLRLDRSVAATDDYRIAKPDPLGSVVRERDLRQTVERGDRVEDAKESQQDAQEEFTSALEALSSLTNFNGGDLESMYNKINDKYQDSEKAAQNVSDRISAIEDVSDALFAEWQEELNLYTSASLRRSSEQKLRETKSSYQTMLSAMKRAEKKMDPVLNTLRDNTLYLKHNLNASAVGSLQGEFMSLEKDIAFAIKQMNAAIEESDKFLAQLNQK